MPRYTVTKLIIVEPNRFVVTDTKYDATMCHTVSQIQGNIIAAALNHCQRVPLHKLRNQGD